MMDESTLEQSDKEKMEHIIGWIQDSISSLGVVEGRFNVDLEAVGAARSVLASCLKKIKRFK